MIIRYLSKEPEKVVVPVQEVQLLKVDQVVFSTPNQPIKHAQEVTETDIVIVIGSDDVEHDPLGKAKLLNIIRYSSQAEKQTFLQEKTSRNVVAIPINIIEKVFIESKSVENFAKKLTFAISHQKKDVVEIAQVGHLEKVNTRINWIQLSYKLLKK